MAAETETREQTETDERVQTAPPWNVIVWDDPISLMTYVTKVFRRVFGYPQAKAERLMMEVHTTGRSVVWTGGREQAEVYASKGPRRNNFTVLTGPRRPWLRCASSARPSLFQR